MRTFTTNLGAATRRETLDGVEYLVAPVVMARDGVEMNGAFLAANEMWAETWNGVPVTLGHPVGADGAPLSAAASPGIFAQSVGTIFNTRVTQDGRLLAEAWINVQRAESAAPGLVEAIESDTLKIQVSTGYFSETETRDGRTYHVKVRPDHLALLPNEEGACNWNDGCGLRANEKKTMNQKVSEAFQSLAKALGLRANTNCQCEDQSMATNDVKKQAESFLKANMLTSAQFKMLSEMDADQQTMASHLLAALGEKAAKAEPAVKEEVEEVEETEGKVEALSEDDKMALNHARKVFNEHRASLVARITANSAMTADQLKDMPVATLETIANGLKPAPDYTGQGGAFYGNSDADEKTIVEAMQPMTTAQVIANKRKGVH